MITDKRQLLYAADGPEHIELYTSYEESIVDWGADLPGLYLTASLNGTYVKLGPFQLSSVREAVEQQLAAESVNLIPYTNSIDTPASS